MRALFVLPVELLPLPVSCRFRFTDFLVHETVSNRFCSPSARKLRERARFFSAKMAATQSTSSVLSHTITLPGQFDQPVSVVAAAGVSEADFRNAIECSLFKQWLKNIQMDTGLLANGSMSVKQVVIQGVDMFGTRVGFLKFKADVIDNEGGSKVPGIVFTRGPAVAVLILLDSDDGETYAVLTEQVRVPVGKLVLELPAGMLDDDKGDIVGTALREVEEETGLKMHKDDLVNLTAFLDPSTGCRVYPSPGGCDEDISVFLYRGRVENEIIKHLHGKETGLRDHGELIRVHAVPYKRLWRMTPDAKVLMAIALYEMALRDELIPPLKVKP